MHDRQLARQARKDEYEERRLRKSLNKLPNDCTVNHLSEMLSSESGTETDDAFRRRSESKEDAGSESGVSSTFDVIEMDSPTRSPLEQEYDIIGSENESEVRDSDKVRSEGHNDSVVEVIAVDTQSRPLEAQGKSDSTDTLINDSDASSDDNLDDLVKTNINFLKSETGKLPSENVAEELNNNTEVVESTHAQRTDSEHSADRTLRPSDIADDCDVTLTLTSPDAVTSDVFSPPRDENRNVIASTQTELNLEKKKVTFDEVRHGQSEDFSSLRFHCMTLCIRIRFFLVIKTVIDWLISSFVLVVQLVYG